MLHKNSSTGCFKKTQIGLHLNPWHARRIGKEHTKQQKMVSHVREITIHIPLKCAKDEYAFKHVPL